jgi:integrase
LLKIKEKAMPQTQIVQAQPQTDTQQLPANLSDLFGGDVTISDEVYGDDARSVKWVLWSQAIESWLQQKKDQSEHTASAYRIAIETFFEWAEWFSGHAVYPGDVNSAMTTEFAAWLRSEGKGIERDPDTGGRAPWERDEFNARHAPDWMRWEDGDGTPYLRRVVRNDNGEVERIEVTRRGPLAVSSVNLKLAAGRNLYASVRAKYNRRLPDGRTFSLWPADAVNPFDPEIIDRHKPPKKRAKYPSVEELKDVLASINTECLTGKRDFALIYGFSQTCRRFSEFINLQWSDIEHTPIPDGPNAGGYRVVYSIAKKRREEEAVEVLDQAVYQSICAYLEAAGRLDREAGIEPDPDEYVWIPLFPERIARLCPDATPEELVEMATTPISNTTFNATLKKYGRRAGVDAEKMHGHGLRHVGARLRYKNMKRKGNVDPQVLQMLLKHEGLNTTMVYINKNLEDPEDPGGREAALELLRAAQNRRTKKGGPGGQQKEMI